MATATAEATTAESKPMTEENEQPVTVRFLTSPADAEEIRDRVHELLILEHQPVFRPERRASTRYPYPHLIRLSPVQDDGRTPAGPPLVVVGKSLSEGGIGFFHTQPLPYRRMIASFHAGDGRWLGFLIDLPWCRFTGEGWYESG